MGWDDIPARQQRELVFTCISCIILLIIHILQILSYRVRYRWHRAHHKRALARDGQVPRLIRLVLFPLTILVFLRISFIWHNDSTLWLIIYYLSNTNSTVLCMEVGFLVAINVGSSMDKVLSAIKIRGESSNANKFVPREILIWLAIFSVIVGNVITIIALVMDRTWLFAIFSIYLAAIVISGVVLAWRAIIALEKVITDLMESAIQQHYSGRYTTTTLPTAVGGAGAAAAADDEDDEDDEYYEYRMSLTSESDLASSNERPHVISSSDVHQKSSPMRVPLMQPSSMSKESPTPELLVTHSADGSVFFSPSPLTQPLDLHTQGRSLGSLEDYQEPSISVGDDTLSEDTYASYEQVHEATPVIQPAMAFPSRRSRPLERVMKYAVFATIFCVGVVVLLISSAVDEMQHKERTTDELDTSAEARFRDEMFLVGRLVWIVFLVVYSWGPLHIIYRYDYREYQAMNTKQHKRMVMNDNDDEKFNE
jgi:hypothetical protein